MEIVINQCFGGFGLSDEAVRLYKEYIHEKAPDLVFSDTFFNRKQSNRAIHWSENFSSRKVYQETNNKNIFENKDPKNDIGIKLPRYDPCLIRVVKELGERANGPFACLKIVEIPEDIKWTIEAFDGFEWISEHHKVLTFYPLYPDMIVQGEGGISQEAYDPNFEYGYKEKEGLNPGPCQVQ